jgi:hypothetical protein
LIRKGAGVNELSKEDNSYRRSDHPQFILFIPLILDGGYFLKTARGTGHLSHLDFTAEGPVDAFSTGVVWDRSGGFL